MGVSIEHTSDGDKLRDTKTGDFLGSLGKGKDNTPTINPVDKVDTVLDASETHGERYIEQHKKLNLKRDPMKFEKLEELVSFVAEDMNWLSENSNVRGWKWTQEDIEYKLDAWLHYDGDIYNYSTGFEEIGSPDPAFRYEENTFLADTPEKVRALRKLGYEHYLAQPLPVFVFGTLRPGQGNFQLFREEGSIETIHEAKILGVAMAIPKDAGFPRALETDDDRFSMVGDVVTLKKDASGAETRRSLDQLEGFNSNRPSQSMYKRVVRDVEIKNNNGEKETIKAWIFITPDMSRLKPEDILVEGDWFKSEMSWYRPERREHDLKPNNWLPRQRRIEPS